MEIWPAWLLPAVSGALLIAVTGGLKLTSQRPYAAQ